MAEQDGSDADTAADIPSPIAKQRAPSETLSVRAGIERYRLGELIGLGGMGEILAATDEHIGREVVVKRMKQSLPHDKSMERFFREACVQGRLDHPAIVPVYDLGVDEAGRPFFTMKKLTGVTLAERIELGQPWQRLLRAFVDVCLAVEFAHRRGVLHRDLKPSNVVLGEYGEVYIIDWGVAKVLDEAEPDLAVEIEHVDPVLTEEGITVGTPGYMSPEQARALRNLDSRTDVYSLGCLLFEILAGEPLHPRARLEALRSVLLSNDTRPSLRAPAREIPPELDALCVAATMRERDDRIQTARELGERVQRFLDGDRDLALRQELAYRHFVSAKAAFAAGDKNQEERRIAMREAGRALALDPKLAGAAELVTRLMLDPPRDIPPQVRASIAADNMDTLRRQSRAGAKGYLAFLAYMPVIVAGGSERLGYAAVMAALIAINCILLLSERGYAHLRVRAVLVAIANAGLILVLARISSPILIAPGAAAVVTMALVFSPTYERLPAALALGGTMAVAIFIPWFAEAVGLVSATMEFTASHTTLVTAMGIGDPFADQLSLVLYVLALLGGAASLAYVNRRTERSVRERLHLQAWQLRQLAPEPAA